MQRRVISSMFVAAILAFGLVFGLANSGLAEVVTSLDKLGVIVSVDDDSVDLSPSGLEVDFDSKTGDFAFLPNAAGLKVDNKWAVKSLMVSGNVDPILNYGLAVVDLGAPSTFSFMFSLPIASIGPPVTVLSSISASVTDGGDGKVDLIAKGTTGTVQESLLGGVNAGVDLGPTIIGIPLVGGSGSYGPFAAGPTVKAISGTLMKINIDFMGSGGGDIYTMNGRFEVQPVPEPSLGLLLGISLVGLVGAGAVRKIRQKAVVKVKS